MVGLRLPVTAMVATSTFDPESAVHALNGTGVLNRTGFVGRPFGRRLEPSDDEVILAGVA